VDCPLNPYPHRELATNRRDHPLDPRHYKHAPIVTLI